MATRSSILTWKIPWTEESGRLQSIGSHSWTRLKHFSMHTQQKLTQHCKATTPNKLLIRNKISDQIKAHKLKKIAKI